MRLVWALLLAAGVLLIVGPRRARPSRVGRHHVDARNVAVSAGCGALAGLAALLVVGVPMVAMLAGALGAATPVGMGRRRARRSDDARRAAWPEAVELVAGTVRAGEMLTGAISVAADRGPEVLREDFGRVVADQRVSGDLVGALERMRDHLADPIADRVVATLVLIHRVGGRESARVLHTLATFLRDDAALRREVAARQSWTTVAARVAVAAPWIVVLLVSARAEGRAAYSTPAGAVVLLVGAVVTFVGYRVMVVTGRIAEPPRAVPSVATP